MSVSVNPVVGWDFTRSLASTYGTAITFAAFGSTARDGTGLILDSNGKRVTVTAPTEVKLVLPITLMIVHTPYAATLGTDEALFACFEGTTDFPYAYGAQARGASTVRVKTTDNNSTFAQTPSAALSTWFYEFRANGTSAWDGTSSVLSDATSRSDPTYTGSSTLCIGGINSTNLGTLVKHAVIWNATLSGADRTALVADPLAYEATSTPFRPYFITG